MNCDRYRNALLDAATRNGKVDAKLAHHLERCHRCRIKLQGGRKLMSRIDSALRERVNEGPRAGFLAEVRVRISKETPANPGSNPVLAAAGVTLAVILIAIFYPLVNLRQPKLEGNHNAPTIRAQSVEGTQPARAFSEDSGLRSRQYSSKRAAATNAVPQEPEVLVPPDEQKAFAQFVARVAGRDAMAEAVVSPAANKTAARNTDLPEVPSVDIADLQLDRAERDPWMDEAGGSE
jgi:hypothetical protein